MGLVITAKIPCNTIDFPTNKGKTLPILKIDNSRIAVRYDDLGITVLKPDIDRITFGFCPNEDFFAPYDPTQDVKEYKEYIKATLFQSASADSTNSGLSLVKGVSFHKKPYCNYNVNLRYKPPSGKDTILIQVMPKADHLAFMRFDMNPSLFSKKALSEFRTFIEDQLLAIPGVCIPYDHFISYAPIYRADICVDILGARPYDLEIITMSNKKPSPQKSHVYKSKTGRAETKYPKTKKRGSDTEYIYDKRKERLDKGEPPVYGDFLHSRFECRVQKTTFSKLENIKNRCVRISVKALDYKKFNKMKYTKRLFIRYTLDRTLDKGLELIPEQFRPEYKKAYEKALRNIWDPKQLWSYWKNTVKTSGLFPQGK